MKLAGTCAELVEATMAGMRSTAKRFLTVHSFHSLWSEILQSTSALTQVQSVVEVPSGWFTAIISAETM